MAVSLAALVFVGLAIHRSFGDVQRQFVSPLFLIAILGCAVAYAVILQLVGIAWYRFLVLVDGASFGLGRALAIFGRIQVYKYLPSNVMHMVGRFALARNAGASNRALAVAQIGELSITVLAAGALGALLAWPIFQSAYRQYGPHNPTLTLGLVAAGLLALAIGMGLFFRFRMADIGGRALVVCAEAFFLYALFFIGNGLLIVALSRTLNDTSHMAELIGIGAVAWLIGFVVPGAPGGLGVREAVLIMGLAAAGLPAPSATAVALGNRLVTVLGDCLVALVELAIRKGKSA
ncbi:uncharacterized membrane protein YbhN (UPF0104 family) [Mesorhizobium sp. USDA 4775]|uniref:lysylphosphatidylglycerol synthase domain-containing protein n=1 Tax=Mesorhizobium jarvisii TaxID=1777867 RepID=UPI00049A9625|nr:lysylphosphatidylglycerol synthase domain-containing protein [Mesorhizobium jarvisii]AID28852.1 hypothetical protein MCHK_1023 [Mesorhizobium huakuii 7653R]MCH4556963.1 lysylphosphatidylglycerol synthase domain-containing protein [Mesorhizobium jarvisii]